MKIRLHLTKERVESVTWGDLADLEEASENGKSARVTMDLAVRFLAGENGEYVSREMGMAYLRKLTLPQMGTLATQLHKAIEEYAVRPTNGDSSS